MASTCGSIVDGLRGNDCLDIDGGQPTHEFGHDTLPALFPLFIQRIVRPFDTHGFGPFLARFAQFTRQFHGLDVRLGMFLPQPLQVVFTVGGGSRNSGFHHRRLAQVSRGTLPQ